MSFVARSSRLHARDLVASAFYALVLSVCCLVLPAYAVDTTINVSVYDNQPAEFDLNASVDAKIDGSITINGQSRNISQIMVYIDGIYSSTFPLDVGAPTFTISIQVSSGEHSVKLVAIDPFTGTQIERDMVVSYVPGSLPVVRLATSSEAEQVVNNVVNQSKATAQKAVDEMQTQINDASTAGPMKQLTDGLYGGMVDLGIVLPVSQQQTAIMVARMVLITLGMLLIMLPWQAYWWVIRRLPFIPFVDEPTIKVNMPIRIIGAVLVAVPFMFMH